LVEFVELLIKAEESVTIDTQKKKSQKKAQTQGAEQAKVFEALSSATQAYSKALKEHG